MSRKPKGLAPLSVQDILEELAEPYSLLRQRLALFLAIKRYNRALLERYAKYVYRRRRLRRLRRLIKRFRKKLRYKRLLRLRILNSYIRVGEESDALLRELRQSWHNQTLLAKEYNFYPVFEITSQNRLFRLLNNKPSRTTQSDLKHKLQQRFEDLTSSELAFLESQLQTLPSTKYPTADEKLFNLAKGFRMAFGFDEAESAEAVIMFLNLYGQRTQYALNFSHDMIRQMERYVSELKSSLYRYDAQLEQIDDEIKCIEIYLNDEREAYYSINSQFEDELLTIEAIELTRSHGQDSSL